jgi:uncharacterized protein (TIGR02147 family)
LPNLFQYTDYRAFLRDYYEWAKKELRGFSHRSFLEKAGMSGPTYLKRVMEGQHDLTANSIPKFIKAMSLAQDEAGFFTALVTFNQAKTLQEKDSAFQTLMALKAPRQDSQLEQSQYDYYRDWYNIGIRELLATGDYPDDPTAISKDLAPPVSPKKVKKALELLKELGLIAVNPRGRLEATSTFLHSDPSIQSLLIPRFHQAMGKLAVEAVERFPKQERYFSGTTVSISAKTYELAIAKIRELRAELLQAVASDPDPDRVYHLNMQWFPLTSGPRKRGRKKR